MIKDLVKGAVKGAARWVGTTLGGETGGNIADKITGSLFEKKAGGGEFEVIDTRVTPPSTGGLMGFKSPGKAGGSSMMRGGAKTVDADTLTAEWNYRLKRYLVDMRYFNRKS